jgi:hypothetical protein
MPATFYIASLPFQDALPNGGCARKLRLAQVRVCCDTPQEASVVDALASFGVVHADMAVTLANIWLAMQGPRPVRRDLAAGGSP